jgi:hypothetical protein
LAGIVTVAGRVTAALLLDRVIINPPAGAVPPSVTVQASFAEPVRDALLQVSPIDDLAGALERTMGRQKNSIESWTTRQGLERLKAPRMNSLLRTLVLLLKGSLPTFGRIPHSVNGYFGSANNTYALLSLIARANDHRISRFLLVASGW